MACGELDRDLRAGIAAADDERRASLRLTLVNPAGILSRHPANTDGYSTKLPDHVVVIGLKALYDNNASTTT